MASSYLIHSERSLVVIARTERIGSDEWEALMNAVLADPAFLRGYALVDDRRESADVPTRSDVERAARWIHDQSARLGAIRWAIVVNPASLAAFGMTRVVEALTSQTSVVVRAFTDLPAATAWATGHAEPL